MTSKAKSFDNKEEELKYISPNLTSPQEITQQDQDESNGILFSPRVLACFCLLLLLLYTILYIEVRVHSEIDEVPVLKVVSMDFITELNNNSTMQQSHYVPLASARWDLSIQVPTELIGDSICLQGDLQASFLYKNVTLVTSSIQSYNKLESSSPQLLNVSAVATGEDLSGAIGKEIMEAIKERKEVRFGARLYLTDCRKETKTRIINYECDEATLWFELESDQIKATLFGIHTTCITTN